MIFADDDPQDTAACAVRPQAAPPPDMPALLAACTDEARHLARALADLDRTLGTALVPGSASGAGPPLAAQALDLLRQEAEVLADVLALVAAGRPVGVVPDRHDLAGALRLHDQRARMFAHPPWRQDTG